MTVDDAVAELCGLVSEEERRVKSIISAAKGAVLSDDGCAALQDQLNRRIEALTMALKSMGGK